MKKISAESSFFMKQLLPLLWFGFVAFILITMILHGNYTQLFAPCFMALFGYYFFRASIWNLMDEVYDCGDSLLVKKAGQEEMVPLSSIININDQTTMITLRLVRGGKFGTDISFSPSKHSPLGLVPFKFPKNEVAEDLIIRVDRARSQRIT